MIRGGSSETASVGCGGTVPTRGPTGAVADASRADHTAGCGCTALNSGGCAAVTLGEFARAGAANHSESAGADSGWAEPKRSAVGSTAGSPLAEITGGVGRPPAGRQSPSAAAADPANTASPNPTNLIRKRFIPASRLEATSGCFGRRATRPANFLGSARRIFPTALTQITHFLPRAGIEVDTNPGVCHDSRFRDAASTPPNRGWQEDAK